MPNTILFFLLFISQIWLISYFFPRKIVFRVDYILKNYPENTHPKLYPEGAEKIKVLRSLYLMINNLMIIIGAGLLIYFSLISAQYAETQEFEESVPLMFGMLQFVPLFVLEILGYRQMRLMREANTATKRKAHLEVRNLREYISPILLTATLATYLAFILFEIWSTPSFTNENFLIKVACISLTNLVFIISGYRMFSGKKKDPHQSDEDRKALNKVALPNLCYISMFVTGFVAAQTFLNIHDASYYQVLINCLYFQVLALITLNNLQGRTDITQIDFSGYKAPQGH